MRAQSVQNQTRMGMDRTGIVFGAWSGGVLNMMVALLVLGGPTIASVPIGGLHEGWAQTSKLPSFVVASFTPGKVTDIQGKTIQINGKNYELKPDVVIQDHEGISIEPAGLVPGLDVKFHLKEGQIDQMVIMLPK